LPSKCSLLFNYADKRTQDFFIEGSYPTPETIKKVYEVLAGLGRKRIELSAAEIASRAGIRNEMAVSSALYTLEKAGHIDRSSSAENRASVRLNVSPVAARAAMGERDSRPRQVLFVLMNGWNLNQRTETAIDVSDIGEELGLEPSAVKRALASLVSENLITYAPASRTRGIVMLDDPPARQLRVRPQEIAKRAALEQRKLREMINFCYTDRCYRAFILDYFGDSHHQSRCGTCGNCAPQGGRKAPKPDQLRQSETASDLDRFIREGRPFGHELAAELDSTTSRKKGLAESERLARADFDGLSVNHARALSNEEKLLVRKILACAARMQGRFGKNMLASTLRGSRARNLLEAGLNELSTYGILSDMTQEELMTYIDGLVVAGALKVSPGAYPMISITAFGGEVMREKADVELSISETPLSRLAHEGSARLSLNRKSPSKIKTVDETYRLHCEGMSVDDIATQRGLTVNTVEAHLAECIVEGREFDMSRHVGQDAYRLISAAIQEHGTSRLRPLKDALPEEITWGMIKFVIADHERSSAK
jgi:ATP-dependent DNA helicase RecQ